MRRRSVVALTLVVGVSVVAAIVVARATPDGPRPRLRDRLSALDPDTERAAQTLAEYVRIDTSTPPGIPAGSQPPYIELLISRYAEPLGLEHHVLDDRSLLLRWRARTAREGALLFLGHADVVPVNENERDDWAHPPFAGAIADGFVWGRGTLDNKGSTVCVLEAIAAMKRAGVGPARDVLVLVVPDEEIGGELGAGRVVRTHRDLLGELWAVIDEGSFILPDVVPGQRLAAVAVAEKRYVTVELVVEGDGGHSSMPRPDDPVRALSRALGRLADYESAARLHPVTDAFLDSIADAAPFQNRLILRNRWLFEPLVLAGLSGTPSSNAILRDTVAITMLEAGVKENVVPGRAEATVNLRLLPDSDLEATIDAIAAAIDDARVEIEVVTDWGQTPAAPFGGEKWRRLESALATALPGAHVVPVMTPASMDARWFAQAGVDTYRFIPFTLDARDRARIHGRDERVSTDDLEQAIETYAHLMRYF